MGHVAREGLYFTFMQCKRYTSSLLRLPITLSAPLSLLTFTPFLTTTPQPSLYALQTLTCCPFLVFALHLPPVVLVLQPPLCGTHSHLAFATLPLPIPSVAFLTLTASSRLLAPPSGSPKCLRFGHWLTLCTLNIRLPTYLLTYLLSSLEPVTGRYESICDLFSCCCVVVLCVK